MVNFLNSSDVEMAGAGMTSFSAAFEGIRRGINPEQIIIREKDLIGGKVQTIDHAGKPFDRCAHWFHGGPDNLVFQWSIKNLLPEIKAAYGVEDVADIVVLEQFKDIWVIGDNGRTERDSHFRMDGHNLTRNLVRDFQQKHPGQDAPLADFVAMAPPDKRETVSRWVRLVESLWIGLPPGKVTSHEVFGEDGSFDDNNGMGRTTDYVIKGGLGRLSTLMADKLQNLGVRIETGYNLLSVNNHQGGFALTYEHNGGIVTSFSRAANITIPVAILQTGAIGFDPEIQQELRSELRRFQNGNFSKIIVPLEPGSLQQQNIADQQRVYSFGKDVGTFFCVFCHHSSSITLFGSDLSQLEGRDPKEIKKLVASVTNAFPELRGLDTRICADPLVINPSSLASLGGAYSARALGCKRPGENFERNGLSVAGEAWALDLRGAKTIEGAWVSGEQMGRYNAQTLSLA